MLDVHAGEVGEFGKVGESLELIDAPFEVARGDETVDLH
jgi:hypothetical protein